MTKAKSKSKPTPAQLENKQRQKIKKDSEEWQDRNAVWRMYNQGKLSVKQCVSRAGRRHYKEHGFFQQHAAGWVKKWVHRLEEERFKDGLTHVADAFKDAKTTGRPENVSEPKIKRWVSSFIKRNHSRKQITMRQFAHKKRIPYSTMRSYFKAIGVRSKLRGGQPHKLTVVDRVKRMAFCYKWIVFDIESFVFEDEFADSELSTLSSWQAPRWYYVRNQKNQQTEDTDPKKKTKFAGKRVDAAMAFTYNEKFPLVFFGFVDMTKRRPYHEIWRKTSTEKEAFVEKMVQPLCDWLKQPLENPRGDLYLYWDNGGTHCSNLVLDTIANEQVYAVGQAGQPKNLLGGYPPNSPDLNPAENVIALLKRREKQARGMRQVDAAWIHQELKKQWDLLSQDEIRNCIESIPARMEWILANHGSYFPKAIGRKTEIPISQEDIQELDAVWQTTKAELDEEILDWNR